MLFQFAAGFFWQIPSMLHNSPSTSPTSSICLLPEKPCARTHTWTRARTHLIRLAAVQDGSMTPCFHNQLDEDPLVAANINSGRETCGGGTTWAQFPSPLPAREPSNNTAPSINWSLELFCCFFLIHTFMPSINYYSGLSKLELKEYSQLVIK